MTRLPLALLFLTFVAPIAFAAEIVLIYPREEHGHPHVYSDTVDSTFIFGHVTPAGGDLTANGHSVTHDDRGAFLAWLSLRKASGLRSWDLVLKRGTKKIATLRVPYEVASESKSESARDTFRSEKWPRVVRVTSPNAHLWTTVSGTYDVFPDSGCKLLAVGREGSFYRVKLCDGLCEDIESQFVSVESDTSLSPAIVGNGISDWESNRAICKFALSRLVAWTTNVSADEHTLLITLFESVEGTNRIRYDVADSLVRDIVWRQLPGRVELEIRCTQPLERGYDVTYRNDSLRIHLAAPYSSAERTLRGKVIVLDPGHGGKADGAIGPLGNKEKDIVLKWAKIVAAELKQDGAEVEFTRDHDEDVSLSARTEYARKVRADFFLSLHCNALPDSENPFIRHGVGTYYYQSGSRDAAERIHKQLIAASQLRDDGLYDANLAVARPTDFPSVLVEAAYLMYPPEERLLESDDFLRALAKGIARGLNSYFQREP